MDINLNISRATLASLVLASLLLPSAALADGQTLNLGSYGIGGKATVEQFNDHSGANLDLIGDHQSTRLLQINSGSRADVTVLGDGTESLIITGKCPPGQTARAVVATSGPRVLRCR